MNYKKSSNACFETFIGGCGREERVAIKDLHACDYY